MTDPDNFLLRHRVVEELVLLAAPGDQQVEFFATAGWPRMELLKGYINWSHDIVPMLNRQGLLSPEIMIATKAVSDALFALDLELAAEYEQTQTIKALTEDGILTDERWRPIRELAGKALSAFRELGVTAPSLLDADYNSRRTSAP